MTLHDAVSYGGGGLLLLSILVQIAPVKISPWSWLARQVGRAINQEQNDKLDTLTREVNALKKQAGEQAAIECRVRILAFGDELYQNEHHTRERFDQIMDDITEYKRYCEKHPLFKNEKTVLTTYHIEKVYQRCQDEHSFL